MLSRYLFIVGRFALDEMQIDPVDISMNNLFNPHFWIFGNIKLAKLRSDSRLHRFGAVREPLQQPLVHLWKAISEGRI